MPKPDNAATPDEATALCFAQPTPDCLLSEALASVPRIEHADFRDWALSEIVVSQAAIGPLETAIAAALTIEDPRSIVTALGGIALSLVESGRLDEALATAAQIPEGAVRADSYSDIAAAQARSGDVEAASETIARIDKPESRVPVLTAMARAELEHGDSAAAYDTLDEAVTQARTIRIAKHRNWTLAGLALVQFEAGDDTGADDTLVLIEDAARLATAYANLARVHAKAGEMRRTDLLLADARALIETIGDRADRYQALSRIAIAEAENGDFEAAYETIQKIEFDYAQTYTLSVVAIVQAAAGEIEPALGLVAGISGDRLRVQTLWTVATVSAPQGEGERAASLRRQALAAARGILQHGRPAVPPDRPRPRQGAGRRSDRRTQDLSRGARRLEGDRRRLGTGAGFEQGRRHARCLRQAVSLAPPRSRPLEGALWMVLSCLCFAAMSGIIRHLSTVADPAISPFEIVFFRNWVSLVLILPWVVSPWPLARSARHARNFTRCAPSSGCRRWPGGSTRSASCRSPPRWRSISPSRCRHDRGDPAARRTPRPAPLGRHHRGLRGGYRDPPARRHRNWPGPILALSSALGFALSMNLIKMLSRTDAPSTIVFYQVLIMTPLSLGPALAVWQTPGWSEFAWLVVLGTLATAAHLSMARSLSVAEASAVASLDFVRLPFVAAIGYFVFTEVPDAMTWIGGAIIIASSVYIARREAIKGRTRALAARENDPLYPPG